jgi:hypothetical protein
MPPSITVPDYSGGSLVNLVAELERRLTGSSPSPGLHPPLAEAIPESDTYVLVLFDGLGVGQLDHPAAADLRDSLVAPIDAPFPSTTTVSLATVATALPPSQHGLLGYQSWIPEVETVVNTIKWTTLWGDPVDFDTSGLLPKPNLWERLAASGREPITVQPGNFSGTPLSQALYRGCREEPVFGMDDTIEATVSLARVPGRLVFTYLPHVDFAAHVYGQDDPRYADAVRTVAGVWQQLSAQLPDEITLVGTADHGHIDFASEQQVRISKPQHADRIFYGDGRAMMVKGDAETMAEALPATWFSLDEARAWWGPGPHHPSFEKRAPDGILVADDDTLLLHRFSDNRMIGNHGGLTDAERLVPLLVR